MRTEVKTLIAALTTERNSIDRAIAALKQMSDSGEPAPQRVTAPVRRVKRHRASPVPMAARRALVDAMSTAEDKWRTARRLATEYGLSPRTIRSGWLRWEREVNQGQNGNVATPEPEYAATV